MIPSLVKKPPLAQTLDGLERRGWITKEIGQSILLADDKRRVLAGHVRAGRVSPAVGRTILKRAEADTKKNETYNDVIDNNVRRLPSWETK